MTNIYLPQSKYSTEVVGEKNYQKAIKEIVMYKELVEKGDLQFRLKNIPAALVPEDDNKFDPDNAVRVELKGRIVGYLSSADAAKYRRNLKKLNMPLQVYYCYASAYGRRDAPRETMNIGIWLSIDLDNLTTANEESQPRKKFLGLF